MGDAKDPTHDFSEEQKHYLEGFLGGVDALRAARGLDGLLNGGQDEDNAAPAGPEAAHFEAQNRVLSAGGKLTKEEDAKRERNPLDIWDQMQANAADERFPQGVDVFRYKFHGLFYVAPNQDSFMCRLRMPNGILDARQLRGIADLADRCGGGYAHVTTRANLQIREIGAADGVRVLTGLQDLGLINRGSGADNIRNITGHPTAGIDPQELIDTRPLCREMHYHILYHRELYGLPRKFNIAFDGGGVISVVADTNDIDFTAVRMGEGREIPAGVYFRMALGGITGHGDFARDAGFLLTPEQCVPMADAVLRVFIAEGDRTDRKKARLKYVLDRLGPEAFLERVKEKLSFDPAGLPLEQCEPRPQPIPGAHIGFHPQEQSGYYYCGVVVPVGKLTCGQMNGLAEIAENYGSGTVRLTVWQNLLVSDIAERHVAEVKQRIEQLGLHWRASHVRAGLIACTGNTGCKFSASDTKTHAAAIADQLDGRLELDRPISIHLTGCPHSCAQHFIGDIGLLGTSVEDDEDEMVEGYDLFVGGGFGAARGLGDKLVAKIKAEETPAAIERLLRVYTAHRESDAEGFRDFVRRQGVDQLRPLLESQTALGAA